MARRFENRREAGQALAAELQTYAAREDLLVLALPRGGVPVAFEVAEALDAPLDVFLVRKLGVPGHEELAMGAIATGGVRVLNEDVIRQLGLRDDQIEQVAEQERQELRRREEAYRGDRGELRIEGRFIILVDDGLATGATMRAAVKALKEQEPAEVVVAVPTAAPESCEDFETEVDEVLCLTTPRPFFGVGGSYADFSQTTDQEVRDLLARARES
ncbi:MAG: phosphoribosyltransferase [Anaerolineales bacterium]